MSVLGSIAAAPSRAVRALSRMVFGPGGRDGWLWGIAGAGMDVDYSREVGDGSNSSVVMAPLLWVMKAFPEAPPILYMKESDGLETPLRTHAVLDLLDRPNPHYTGPLLWMSTILDWHLDGNAYWLLLRDEAEAVREIWWAPAASMTPCGDERELVTHYEYRVGGAEPLPIRVQDCVHFRFGIDPGNPRKGRSPLASVIREVFTDDEGARFTAALLRNSAIPGLVMSPETGSKTPGSDDVEMTKAYMREMFTGSRRGEPLIMSGTTRVAQFGFSPEQLTLRELRKIPEERTSAVLGVPAIVAGLGAGLDRSTFTNMGEARAMAYESNIIPSQRILGEEVRFQLLPAFGIDPTRTRFGFDLSKVRTLQDDQDAIVARGLRMLAGSAAKRSEVRQALGLKVATDGSDDVYLIPANIAEVPADTSKPHRSFGSTKASAAQAAPDDTGAEPAYDDSAALAAAAASNGNGGHS